MLDIYVTVLFLFISLIIYFNELIYFLEREEGDRENLAIKGRREVVVFYG